MLSVYVVIQHLLHKLAEGQIPSWYNVIRTVRQQCNLVFTSEFSSIQPQNTIPLV